MPSRNFHGWDNIPSALGRARELTAATLGMKAQQCREQPAVMGNGHSSKRVVEAGPAVTTDFVAVPLDGENAAQFPVVTPERKLQNRRQRMRHAIPQRNSFVPRHQSSSTVQFFMPSRKRV
jgi:hypothetical protein